MAFLNWFKRCSMKPVRNVDIGEVEDQLPCDLNDLLSSNFCAALFTIDRQLASLDLTDPMTSHDLSSMRDIYRKRNDIFFTVESYRVGEIKRYRVLLGDCQTSGDNVGFIVVNPDEWKVEFDRPLIVAELTRELNQFFDQVVVIAISRNGE